MQRVGRGTGVSVSDRDSNDLDATSDTGGGEGDLGGSRRRFESALEHAAIGIALISPEGRWLRANSALCDLVGYKEGELLTKTLQDLTYSLMTSAPI